MKALGLGLNYRVLEPFALPVGNGHQCHVVFLVGPVDADYCRILRQEILVVLVLIFHIRVYVGLVFWVILALGEILIGVLDVRQLSVR